MSASRDCCRLVSPRYYQANAINRTMEAIANGQDRVLLLMATGTGKTYTAFQIIWRLWKAGHKKRILFLADRNILVDQTKTNDFKPFGTAMTKITGKKVDKAYEIFLSLYQAITGPDESDKAFKKFSPDFFDLIVIDECHRGSAREDSQWREILDYFSEATHLGLTATPKETKEVSSIDYFGKPVYEYSLKQGIDDGFLAPYRVIRIHLDFDMTGWRPPKDIWFYEHPYPPGAKSYNKTKPIAICEFDAEKKWWGKPDTRGGFKGRKASELAWKVTAAEIKENGYNLDIKNPHSADTGPGDPDELLVELESIRTASRQTLDQPKSELAAALSSVGD